MSEHKENPQLSPSKVAEESSPTSSGDTFRRAESLLAIESEDTGQTAREAYGAIENRQAADRQSGLIDAAGALRRSSEKPGEGDEVDGATEAEVDDALDQKALEDGVAAADETAHVAWELTPHNL